MFGRFINDLQGPHTQDNECWTLYIDESSNPKGVVIVMVLEGPNQVLIEKSLHLAFKTSNN